MKKLHFPFLRKAKDAPASIRQKPRLKVKLVRFTGISLLCVIAIISCISFFALDAAYDTAIEEKKAEFDVRIRDGVDTIITALEANQKLYEEGGLPSYQVAQEVAKAIVRDARYDSGSGYFWADASNGICITHMNTELEGKNRIDYQDDYGTYYIKNLIEAGKYPQGGFTEYYFEKPGEEGSFYKRAYTRQFEPYGWYISTGNYYEDIDAAIAVYQKEKIVAMSVLLGVSILLLAVGVGYVVWMANLMSRPIELITKRLLLLSQGDLHSPPAEVGAIHERETQQLADAAHTLIQYLNVAIEDIRKQLHCLAEGNMTEECAQSYIGDFLPIQRSLTEITAALQQTFLTIRTSAEQVTAGATQVSMGAQSLAAGTTEQSGALDQLTRAVEGIAAKAKDNAEQSVRAAEHVQIATESIQGTNTEMDRMLKAMQKIDETSNEIRNITRITQSIAFQTNILSLNASIEAARAGAAGKGFAVVADEVRNLATKSAESAKQIDELIQATADAIAAGSEISQSMAVVLVKSLEETSMIQEAVSDIEVSSGAQAESITEIMGNLEQIAAVVQSNAAAAEESSAASEELSAQATLLYEELEKFTLE